MLIILIMRGAGNNCAVSMPPRDGAANRRPNNICNFAGIRGIRADRREISCFYAVCRRVFGPQCWYTETNIPSFDSCPFDFHTKVSAP